MNTCVGMVITTEHIVKGVYVRRIRIVPYKIGSQSAKLLARELEILRCNPLNTRFKPRMGDVVINWGNSRYPTTQWVSNNYTILNHQGSVMLASDKILALNRLQERGVSVIPFTQEYSEAYTWLEGGSYVYERTITRGHGGQGINVVHTSCDLAYGVPLYTRGIPIRREYRVHVFKDKVIDHVQKRRTFSNLEVNEYVRNHTHGWVFVRNGFDPLEEVEREAILAIKTLGLDFGAVDVIVEKHTGKVFVLEVNTAPGFSGADSSTLASYVRAFKEELQYVN